MKMLKHNKIKNVQPCLAELSLNLTLDGSFDQSSVLSFEKLQVALENTKLTFYGGLYEFIKDSKTYKAPNVKSNRNECPREASLELYDKFVQFSTLIPKMLSVGIQNTSLSIVRENTSHVHDYLANIKSMTLNWKITFSPLEDLHTFKFISTYFSYEMSELIVDTSSERLLALDQHSIDFKLNNEVINIYTKLKSFKLTYNHCDIIDWIKKNLVNTEMMSKSLQLRESSPQSFSSKGLEKVLGNCVMKICVEFWNISTICQLSNNQVSSINLAHTQLLMNQSEETKTKVNARHFLNKRGWNAEIMIESLCFYLDSNVKNVSGSNLKKTHVRGSAFYCGVLLRYFRRKKYVLLILIIKSQFFIIVAKFRITVERTKKLT